MNGVYDISPGMFTRKEVKDIVISVIVLTLVFAYPEFLTAPMMIFISLFVVGIAFMGHELSHRFTARKLGFFAEYRIWPQGIILAIFFTLFTNGAIIFAAPGAIVFGSIWAFRNPTVNDVGRIGISGIAFNMVLMLILIMANFIYPHWVLVYAALINVWLAIFNLIPIGPLDGKKVLRWNRNVWGISFLIAIISFAYLILFF